MAARTAPASKAERLSATALLLKYLSALPASQRRSGENSGAGNLFKLEVSPSYARIASVPAAMPKKE
jgi:hypothetical protein